MNANHTIRSPVAPRARSIGATCIYRCSLMVIDIHGNDDHNTDAAVRWAHSPPAENNSAPTAARRRRHEHATVAGHTIRSTERYGPDCECCDTPAGGPVPHTALPRSPRRIF